MANSMWNLRTSGQEAEIQQTVLAHVVEQIVAEPAVEQIVAEPVVEQVVAVIVEPVVEVQVVPEVAATWSSTWTRAQLMKHATSLGLPVTLSSTKNEIIEALTRASG